jgi:hypothetical protein
MKTNGQLTEWIGFTSQNRQEDPPEPDEVETSMRETKRYIEFADRMIRAVHGKSIFSSKAATTDFEDLVMPSQEAFTPPLHRNGYKNWVSVHDTSAMTSSSQESEADQRPAYQYTTRKHADLTSRNGSREGNDKYVELYDRVKQDRLIDNGVFKESTWRTGLRREQR